MNRNMNYIYGNNAVDTNTIERDIYKDKRQKELEDFKKQHRKQKKEADLNFKKKAVLCVFIAFGIGVSIVQRYSMILGLEREISNVKNEISEIDAANEDLRIQLLKIENISSVEDLAKDELGMFQPSIANSVSTNLSKDNFTENNDFKMGKNTNVLDYKENF